MAYRDAAILERRLVLGPTTGRIAISPVASAILVVLVIAGSIALRILDLVADAIVIAVLTSVGVLVTVAVAIGRGPTVRLRMTGRQLTIEHVAGRRVVDQRVVDVDPDTRPEIVREGERGKGMTYGLVLETKSGPIRLDASRFDRMNEPLARQALVARFLRDEA